MPTGLLHADWAAPGMPTEMPTEMLTEMPTGMPTEMNVPTGLRRRPRLAGMVGRRRLRLAAGAEPCRELQWPLVPRE